MDTDLTPQGSEDADRPDEAALQVVPLEPPDAPAPSEPPLEPPDAPALSEEPLEPPDAPAPSEPPQEPATEPLEPVGMLVLGGTPLLADPIPGGDADDAGDAGERCGECGGTFGAEGYCDQCGAARPDERLHYEIDAGHGVAGVCDRGIRHITNEDAVAVAADHDGTRRVALVVADGVSTAPRSAEASTAAVQAALDVLTTARSTGLAGVAAALVGALRRRLIAATEAAADAVRDVTAMPDDGAPDLSGIRKAGHPACTFVAAIIEGDTVAIGSLGDSRAYWLPDAGAPQRLTEDDSWANEQIRLGVDPAEAEAGPHAHTITKWLGVDCPDMTPEITSLTLTEPGYLLVCSDGLWNYASAPDELAAAVQQARAALPPEAAVLDLASALVDWANARGGQDNVTVALARIDDTAAAAAPAEHADHAEPTEVLEPVEATEPAAPAEEAVPGEPTQPYATRQENH